MTKTKRLTIRSIRPKTVTKVEHDIVVKYARRCVAHLNKSKYELPDLRKMTLEVKTGTGNMSYGGSIYNQTTTQAHILIGVKPLRGVNTHMQEYTSYTADPIIGSVHCIKPELKMFVIVAHEIAHAVQYTRAKKSRWAHKMTKPHGDGFRMLYRWLRRDLVNPIIAQAKIEHIDTMTDDAVCNIQQAGVFSGIVVASPKQEN